MTREEITAAIKNETPVYYHRYHDPLPRLCVPVAIEQHPAGDIVALCFSDGLAPLVDVGSAWGIATCPNEAEAKMSEVHALIDHLRFKGWEYSAKQCAETGDPE